MKPEKEYTGRSNIRMYNCDCMELMRSGKTWDLAIIDPPYGIGKDGTQGFATKKTKGFTFNKKEYKQKSWDSEIPLDEYFYELQNVSKNQIIWGANYFIEKLPHLKNFVYWHKKGKSEDEKFNEGEIAFVSCGRSRMIDIWWNGFGTINSGEIRTHPTQKPVKLYTWLLTNYAKPGNTILDTHGGSMSIAIACWDLGFDLDICELDSDYFNDAVKRFENHIKQTTLF